MTTGRLTFGCARPGCAEESQEWARLKEFPPGRRVTENLGHRRQIQESPPRVAPHPGDGAGLDRAEAKDHEFLVPCAYGTAAGCGLTQQDAAAGADNIPLAADAVPWTVAHSLLIKED